MEHACQPSSKHEKGNLPNSQVFSKVQEFGADEGRFTKKLANFDELLHNYKGLPELKDNFAKMLYSSSSKFFMSKKGGNEMIEEKPLLQR